MPDLEREYAFLSYAHEDLEKVRKVYEGLKERKVNVWFDKKDLAPGRWMSKIKQAIARSKYFIICISESAIRKMEEDKGFQKDEFSFAFEIAMNQPEDVFCIIPVRLEDCGRGDLRLTIYQQYDLYHDFEHALDTLAVNLGGKSLSDASAKDKRTEDEKWCEGLMGRGDTFYFSGEYDKALSFYEVAIDINPDYPEAWYNKGNALYDLGRPEEAIKAYDKALELNQDYPEAWYNKGVTLGRLSSYEEALEAFNKALELNPDFHGAWYNKGVALGRLGRYNEALKAFDKALELNQDFSEAWYNKGVTLGKLGRHEEALKAYDKALELKPDYPEAWYNLACLYSVKKKKRQCFKISPKGN